MNLKNHHKFTLWIHSIEWDSNKVPGIYFEEGISFDKILLTMLSLDQLGLYCSLTCDTWSDNFESEDSNND